MSSPDTLLLAHGERLYVESLMFGDGRFVRRVGNNIRADRSFDNRADGWIDQLRVTQDRLPCLGTVYGHRTKSEVPQVEVGGSQVP